MSTKKKKKVFVGLSGGVDSSVAALLLKKKGYDVTGVFIHSYNVDGCEEEDAEYARRAAEKLGIPFYVFDMREEYFSRVVAEMIDGYRRGITPNPDILCNREIKFGLFWERAKDLGADAIATGHYVRLKNGKLLAAKDKNKDQSYFLWKLTPKDLEHCLFPVGEYLKPDVRKIATKAGLPTAAKKDSQGICFLGKVKLPEFLKKYISPKKGKILDTEGNVLGEHDGAVFYTIGQRHVGTQILGKKGKDPNRFYVAAKDAETNTLTVAEGESHPTLYRKEVEIVDVNFLVKPEKEMQVMARARYRQPLQAAKLMKKGNGYMLEFACPVKFVAPGQSAVFYSKKGELLGGGVIKKFES